ncbi:MAG: uracil-DNA glycosylase, partial [Candidatus Thermoplasmatota archaeon]|nr:uracil-DNA glycosylase [Candidatus Thermoplasmatota archaeon]
KCSLYKNRTNIVFGEGSLNAKIMFIGEAPGYYEDIQGQPFVGRAGKILDDLFNSIKLKRNNVFITNVLICRPPKNRNPLKKEIDKCKNYLDKKIEIIKPKILVPMGNFASSYVFDKFGLKKDKISNIHGKIFEIKNAFWNIKIIPIYHPASAIYNNNIKKILYEDIKLIKNILIHC